MGLSPIAHRIAAGVKHARRSEELQQIVDRIYLVLYRNRRIVTALVYGLITAIAFAGAVLLRFEFEWPGGKQAVLGPALALLVAIRVVVARAFRLSTGRWRYVSTGDVLRLVAAATVGSAMFYASTRMVAGLDVVPRSVILIEWLLTTCMTAGLWLSYRVGFERLRYMGSSHHGAEKRVLVLGAGEAGNMLVREMLRYPVGYRPVGFVDDDATKAGSTTHGVAVLGRIADLPRIVSERHVEELVIAIPSASPEDLRRIVEVCEQTQLRFKMLPGITEVFEGHAHLSQLREVRIEDLLGREPVDLELPDLEEDLRGRAVLVTGAAGSIGSELSRQIALHTPAVLVLMDQAETELVYLDNELRERHPDLRIVPVIGDITMPEVVERVFHHYRPERVFHAAAYKHVPMMEVNPIAAVRNNVIGTYLIADAAGRFGSEKFVLVSTDKAVRPRNVMGATKRAAELIVLELQAQYPATAFGAVRFGNVLGSNGSVLPMFHRQLAARKPLTVTHPEVTRYFMTIPEAVQLILQASLLPDLRGSVAMLEMGDPVRILDLARNLLRLSGAPRQVGRDIVITGLRAGEKLHEELVAPDEATRETSVPKVRIVVGATQPQKIVDEISELRGRIGSTSESEAIEWLYAQVVGMPLIDQQPTELMVSSS